jgi:uroporphyrinogen decarboxylase
MNEAGADALSVDWRVSLADARFRLGDDVTLQGNLDPSALFASPDVVHARVEELLRDRAGDPAYIFNLGHGVLPGTPVESVRALVDTVKAFRRGVK